MEEDRTSPRTIWTQTLLDMLVAAVASRQDQDALRMLHEIKAKGLRKADVLAFAGRKLDTAQVERLQAVIRAMGGRKKPAA